MKFMGGLPMPNLIPEPADLPVLQQTGLLRGESTMHH